MLTKLQEFIQPSLAIYIFNFTSWYTSILTAMNNLYSVISIYFYFLRIKSSSPNRDRPLFRVTATFELVLLIATYLISHIYLENSNSP